MEGLDIDPRTAELNLLPTSVNEGPADSAHQNQQLLTESVLPPSLPGHDVPEDDHQDLQIHADDVVPPSLPGPSDPPLAPTEVASAPATPSASHPSGAISLPDIALTPGPPPPPLSRSLYQEIQDLDNTLNLSAITSSTPIQASNMSALAYLGVKRPGSDFAKMRGATKKPRLQFPTARSGVL